MTKEVIQEGQCPQSDRSNGSKKGRKAAPILTQVFKTSLY